MAISTIEYRFLAEAHRVARLPQGGRVLELGEANTNRINTYALDTAAAIEELLPQGNSCDALVAQARQSQISTTIESRYAEAKMLYKALFNYSSYAAVDLLPPADYRLQRDLNQPFDLGERYEVVINNGTSEHVFNQANCYKVIHDHTKVEGVMIHWTPCIGWVNHGLFHVQPGFFFDLAASNDYEMALACLAGYDSLYELKPGMPEGVTNALACVVLRKLKDQPFRFPLQGKYAELKKYAAA